MKIKNNSGVWLFQRENATFYRGIQAKVIQWGGKKYYETICQGKRKLCNTLPEAKTVMAEALEKAEKH